MGPWDLDNPAVQEGRRGNLRGSVRLHGILGTHWKRRGGFLGTQGGRGLTVSSDCPQSGGGSCGRMARTGGREREKGEEKKQGSQR